LQDERGDIATIMIALLLALVLSSPAPPKAEVVEVNTYHSGGRIVLTQILLKRWLNLSTGSSHYIEEWRLVAGDVQPYWRHGKRLIDVPTASGTITIEVRSLRESRTSYDPEVAEREIRPMCQRRAVLETTEATE
jgi:hypothetical protein